MGYTPTQIVDWAIATQPYSLVGEDTKRANIGGSIDKDLHIKLYVERKTLEWQLDQDPNDDDGLLFPIANYVYALTFPYLFQGQQAIGGGGQIVNPTTPAPPDPEQFEVSAGEFMQPGDTSKQFPDSWRGFNLLFFRGTTTQRTNVPDFGTYYSWNKNTAILTLLAVSPTDPAAVQDEEFQFFPI